MRNGTWDILTKCLKIFMASAAMVLIVCRLLVVVEFWTHHAMGHLLFPADTNS